MVKLSGAEIKQMFGVDSLDCVIQSYTMQSDGERRITTGKMELIVNGTPPSLMSPLSSISKVNDPNKEFKEIIQGKARMLDI